jgi:plastocyanin
MNHQHSRMRSPNMRRSLTVLLLAALVLVTLLFVASCGGGTSNNPYGGSPATTAPATTGSTSAPGTTSGSPTTAAGGGGATTQVVLQNIQISPTSVTIKVGDTVTWTNKDSFDHHLVGDKNEFDSGAMAAGATFSFTFKTAGTVTYHCSIHPEMVGTIIVQ